ncbi:Signal recognition particle subunit SRP54 [Halorhabdus sp. SVX81]|nr:Signal recognition particle subunit SRP54 [Halorhabdus sp. SVX81]
MRLGKTKDYIRELLEQHKMMDRTLNQFQGMGDADMERTMKQIDQGDMGGGGMGGLGPFGLIKNRRKAAILSGSSL